ncbi:MAG: MinD/ParA family protein, partial [Selenomonadaceae bacterium]|nr:MinD/ParA family protein [Selenomonadaceae bacterium]
KKFLNMPVTAAGYIFEDRKVAAAVRKQKPFLAVEPDSLASRCVKAMAESLLYGGEMHIKQGWRGFLKQIFNFSGK